MLQLVIVDLSILQRCSDILQSFTTLFSRTAFPSSCVLSISVPAIRILDLEFIVELRITPLSNSNTSLVIFVFIIFFILSCFLFTPRVPPSRACPLTLTREPPRRRRAPIVERGRKIKYTLIWNSYTLGFRNEHQVITKRASNYTKRASGYNETSIWVYWNNTHQ